MVHLTYTRADGEVKVTLYIFLSILLICHHVKDVNVTVIVSARAFFNQNIVLVEVICHDKVKNIEQLHCSPLSSSYFYMGKRCPDYTPALERDLHAISR